MSDFASAWNLSRGRFEEALAGLSQTQLNWRSHPGALTLGEMALHVAGVEVFFASQLTGRTPDGMAARLTEAATDGVVNDHPFPFSAAETTPELVAEAHRVGREWWGPLASDPIEEIRNKSLTSALGPVITGDGALARLSFHAAYHQGQAHLYRTSPGFPA